MKKRAAGILLHITSLPSKGPVGDLGPAAYDFVDFLCECCQGYWQVLPINPPTPESNNSPYTALSAFAGNTALISPELLYRDGLLKKQQITPPASSDPTATDYNAALEYKNILFDEAFQRFRPDAEFEKFCDEHNWWLRDYADFIAIKKHYKNRSWRNWPGSVRDRDPERLAKLREKLACDIAREKFLQYQFYRQWFALKKYANQKGVQIIGDIPIYVAYESADLWSHPKVFQLTKTKRPAAVAGVPPDLFSETGQLWGNPLFDWDYLKSTGYDWWIKRLKHNLALFDSARIDHFRGFIGYWRVPARAGTAIDGKWIEGPKEDFFNVFFEHCPFPPIIVEDLGYITADVREFIQRYDLPCMKVLMFAFDGDPAMNPYCLHNHTVNSLVYTGTHDNNTARGWFENDIDNKQKKRFFDYIGRKIPASRVHKELTRLAMSSVSQIAIIPMQDILGLDASARMNHPAKSSGNWRWRLSAKQINKPLTEYLHRMTQTFGRA